MSAGETSAPDAPRVRCCNRCPGCAYPLDGLPGVPQKPYEPFTAQLACPECGQVVPVGARCVVGSTLQLGAEGSRRVGWLLAGVVALALIMAACVIVSAQWGGPITFSSVGCLGPVAVVAGSLYGVTRNLIRLRQADHGHALGGGDLRLLIEPGVLRVFSGRPGSREHCCLGSDVTQVSATSIWRFWPRAGAEPLMALYIHTPVPMGSASSTFGVIGYFLVPKGELPTQLASDFAATLRQAVPAGTEAPAPMRVITPDRDPRCPRCHAALPRGPVVDGPWDQPLLGDVVCGSCGMVSPPGAYVLSGWGRAPSGLSRAGKLAMWMVAVALGVFTILWFLVSFPASKMPWQQVLLLQIVLVLGFFLLPRVYMRLRSERRIPRPRGRFQPTDCTWIVEPGQLRIVRRGSVVSIPKSGLGRIHLSKVDAAGPSFVLPESLTVRGAAQQLGLMGEAILQCPMHDGVDRLALVERLNQTLHS